ncbi:hypothetical protein [Spiroplasma ixodetis]|uniref:hypothetical protein n=1 Tax=Spiroplasma ixodetis TaxID=2141 RepID=UPI0025751211|nr:hypothetical protein [Spiroplasma ixodetis]WJG70780.1 hypothetical protein SIXOD_v1c20140 [Spiroplasma ixodetis Y32]
MSNNQNYQSINNDIKNEILIERIKLSQLIYEINLLNIPFESQMQRIIQNTKRSSELLQKISLQGLNSEQLHKLLIMIQRISQVIEKEIMPMWVVYNDAPPTYEEVLKQDDLPSYQEVSNNFELPEINVKNNGYTAPPNSPKM